MRTETAQPRRRKPYPTFRGWWIVFVTFLALFLHGPTTSYLFGVLVVPMEEGLGWDRTTLTGAVTVATFVSAAVGLFIGPMFDRHGVRVGMTVSAVAGGLLLILLAFVETVWQYYLLLGFGIGASRAALENVGPRTALANWFVRRRAAAFAWSSGGRALFGFVMVPPIAFLVEQTSWRAGWALMGVLCLVVLAPLSWITIRRRPEDMGQLPDGDPPIAATGPERTVPAALREVQWTRAEAVRTRAFWFLVLGFVLTGFPATGIITNMIPYFQDNGMSSGMASLAYSTYAFGAIFGRPLWGYVAGRYGVHAALTIWGFGYGVSIALFVIGSNPVALFLTVIPLGLLIGGVQQLQSQAWPDYFGRYSVGAITGLSILLTTPAMAFGPLAAAFASDITGTYVVIFGVYGAISFLAGVCFYLAKRPVKKVPQGL